MIHRNMKGNISQLTWSSYKTIIRIDFGYNKPNTWFEFRICGIGIDVNYTWKCVGWDKYRNQVDYYAKDKHRRRFKECWDWRIKLSTYHRIRRWCCIYLGWMRCITFYNFNEYKQWHSIK